MRMPPLVELKEAACCIEGSVLIEAEKTVCLAQDPAMMRWVRKPAGVEARDIIMSVHSDSP